MTSPSFFPMLSFLFFLIFSFSWVTSAHTHESFLQCLDSQNSHSISKLIYSPINSSYSSILQFSIHNLRFNTSSTPKPLVIVTPTNISHIQAAIICSQKHGMQIRIRSGGHDYEGLSYVSTFSFVVIDLINLRTINVDAENKTAWVQSGATIGEVYYRIAEKSRTLAFPASVCPTRINGRRSILGHRRWWRKYFWCGYCLENKSSLSSTFCDCFQCSKNTGTKCFQACPSVAVLADKLHEDLFIRIILNRVNSTEEGKSNTTIQASFNSLFLGGIDRLLPLIQDSFPELGLVKEDCIEMSWIQSVLYFDGFPSNSSLDVLLDRTPSTRRNFKAKSDHVKEPISELGLEGIWERFFDKDINTPILIFSPYGGKMSEISESSIPFPHRAENIYKIQHLIYWDEEGIVATKRHISWIRRLYSYLAPYVSKTRKAAYVNYRDLDTGINNPAGNTSYRQASIWGLKYFKNNFDRLVHVKTAVDPANFFRNEQSIPPLSSW
ncbi:PREDICTED: tetrahydrocannabinolic acid synthase-like [Populus euphratica]|uniref:Tetrahydrocannabinolic acid synthase-like n=1 Tax=Populus euphratica TaxID=75702 RepID=A0AAJ6X3Z6_POPEU|nr:PREDICTED: tetrahydrocannabinolic acid synthase-like [Populus euphratica]